jgi:hypothetical protein
LFFLYLIDLTALIDRVKENKRHIVSTRLLGMSSDYKEKDDFGISLGDLLKQALQNNE